IGQAFGLTPFEFVAVAAAGGWLLRRLAKGGGSLGSPVTLPLGLLLVAHLPGLFLADDRFAVVKQLTMWTVFYLLVLAALDDRDERTPERLLAALAAAGAIVAAVAIAKAPAADTVTITAGSD